MIEVAVPNGDAKSMILPLPRASAWKNFTLDARFAMEDFNCRMSTWGFASMLVLPVILSAIILAAGEGGLFSNLMAVAALITALATGGKVLISGSKWRRAIAHEQEERGRTLARLDRLSDDNAELQAQVDNLGRKLEEKDRQFDELEWRSADQQGQLETMRSILVDIGLVIREDGIKSVRLETVYQRFELVQTRIRRGDTPPTQQIAP